MTDAPIPESHLRLKRAYEPAEPGDGTRILVDRLWPRGVSKAKAALDDWIKEIAPSTELRKWFGMIPLAGRVPAPLSHRASWAIRCAQPNPRSCEDARRHARLQRARRAA
jgi:hypothetical protein